MALVHHTGLAPADIEASLRFYTEGVGLEVLMDVTVPSNLEGLLGVPTEKWRTVFLGDRSNPDAGILEILDLGTGHAQSEPPQPGVPVRGACLLSFITPVQEALARLEALGMGGTPRVVKTVSGGLAATVADPDGVVVEFLDHAPSFG
ncbi:MAG: VOC family protein [Frankiaceae bacterium]|nr:VOC family protein [Frankiaceae bacterium]MBV9870181.1 VOC family protein [Frankiaceae bacterium]